MSCIKCRQQIAAGIESHNYHNLYTLNKYRTITNYQQHVETYCLEGHGNSHSPISTIDDVLAKSPDAPLTPHEMKLTTSLVHRQESYSILKVKTGGQVYNVVMNSKM